MLEIGAEAARKRLPELLDRAHIGEQTIVKKRGIPYAAIVALDQRVIIRKEGLLSLKASGRGLWGKNSNKKIDQYRNEWE